MQKRPRKVLPLFLGSVLCTLRTRRGAWRIYTGGTSGMRMPWVRLGRLVLRRTPGQVPCHGCQSKTQAMQARRGAQRIYMSGTCQINSTRIHLVRLRWSTPRQVLVKKTTAQVAVASSKNSSVTWVTRPKIVYFLHLHKSGGTSVCSAAKASGLHVDKHNCNVQADQRCCGGETVAEQQQFARNTKYDFVACESYMYAEMDLEYYTYVTVLRNSMARYMSHYNHVMRARQTESFDAWLSGQPDNWNVRHICGSRCMQVPKFALSRDDFYFAARRLSQFSHILFHETLRESFDAMVHKLKWKHLRLQHDQASPKTYMYAHANWTSMTCLDDLLYAKAKQNKLLKILPSEVDALIKVMNVNVTKYKHPCGTSCSRYR